MKRRMLRGELYLANDAELEADIARAQALVEAYNATTHEQAELRDRLLRALVGSVGDASSRSPRSAATTGATSRSAPARS
jgi:maltose O-acetyltransferase